MVGLNPVLNFLITVEESLSRGEAVRDAVLAWLGRERTRSHDFQREVLEFLRKTERIDPSYAFDASDLRCRTLFRHSLFAILADGMNGSSILPRLRELRIEVEAQLELDMKAHVESLPLKMLVPLLLCMFPAFLILLLGPITRNFVEALQ